MAQEKKKAKTAKKKKAPSTTRNKYGSIVAPNLKKIVKWTMDGATAKEVAKKLGIGYSTFKGYLDRGRQGEEPYVALSDAYARACVVPDDEVEAALYKRATGYQYTEITVEEKLDRDGIVHSLRKEVTKDIPPDVDAQKFWLTNRRRDHWAYKPEAIQGDGEEHGVIMMPAIDAEPTPPPELIEAARLEDDTHE